MYDVNCTHRIRFSTTHTLIRCQLTILEYIVDDFIELPCTDAGLYPCVPCYTALAVVVRVGARRVLDSCAGRSSPQVLGIRLDGLGGGDSPPGNIWGGRIGCGVSGSFPGRAGGVRNGQPGVTVPWKPFSVAQDEQGCANGESRHRCVVVSSSW